MRYFELPPPPSVRHLVHCVWCLTGRGDGAVEPVVPDGRAELIVHLREPFAEVLGSGARRQQAQVLVSGQLTGPFHVVPSADADVIGIRLRTPAARAAIGVDMHELAGRVLPLADVRRDLALELEHAAGRHTDPAARASAVAEVVGRHARGRAAGVHQAVRLLDRAEMSVESIARGLGTTPRTLERRLLAEVGLPARALRSVLRFRRAFRRLSAAPAGTWARVAAECGYYDQAHMNRAFRRFAGAPPSAFFRAGPALASAFLAGDAGDIDGMSRSS